MSLLLDELNRIPGFKISRSHFKIGTKLHLSDFYYAKLCFQNSFYSSRFAFLIARQMKKDISEKDWDDIRNRGLTLVGYGLFSEFMLSLTQRFIEKLMDIPPGFVNFNIVSDTPDLFLLKKEMIHPNAVIIIPVACTLSTSIKVEQFLLDSNIDKNIHVHSPHYNLLHVFEQNDPLNITKLEEGFGWTKKDPKNRTVTVRALYDGVEKKTRYFLKLHSIWSHPQYCSDCFPIVHGPNFPTGELPLLEADRTSLAPRIIFDYPRGKLMDAIFINREFQLTPRMIHYRPGASKGHFLYQIDLNLFLEENKNRVSTWLSALKSTPNFKRAFKDYTHIIILAPAQPHNTSFLLLVNEILFSSSANIIHYDPSNDYIQNFENLYGKELREADKVIFVNDSLSSAQHFFKLNELFRQACRNDPANITSIKMIDMAIILIDQSPSIIQGAVQDRLGKELGLNCFLQLNLFTSLSIDDPSLAYSYAQFYEGLINDSLLDGSKVHFIEQRKKFYLPYESLTFASSPERHWWMVRATHNLYSFFHEIKPGSLDEISFADFFELYSKGKWLNNIYTPVTKISLKQQDFNEEQAALLKVLTHIPFTKYGPVLKLTFRWVTELLETHQKQISIKIHEDITAFTIEDIKWLRFLIRRAGILNINYLISLEFLKFLGLLFSKGIPYLQDLIIETWNKKVDLFDKTLLIEEEKEKSIQVEMLSHFHIYFAAQVKLLLFENEQRSIHLEENIQQLEIVHQGFLQQVRVLQDENTVVINRFCQMLSMKEDWRTMQIENGIHPALTKGSHPLKTLLNEPEVHAHQHGQSLKLFFEKSKEQMRGKLADNPFFLNFLWLRHFLQFEDQSEKTLIEKTKFIFERIKDLLEFKNAHQEVTDKVGVFLLVKNYKNDLSLVYELYEEKPLLEQFFWRNGDEQYLQEFLKGKPGANQKYHKTIIELNRPEKDKPWYDLYGVTGDNEVKGLSPHFLPDNINHLILLRLNKRTYAGDEELGLLGIYFSRKDQTIVEINRIRYLLLFRESLINFVEKHMRSNEFLELQEAAEAKSMILLAGHGREMIINLSTRYPKEIDGIYKNIAASLGQIQHIITMLKYGSTGKSYAAMIGGIYDIYHERGNSILDKSFFERLLKMAIQIFEFPQIETKVKMLPIDEIGNISFAFNKQLMEIIFFELLVNAKKNRWHFLLNAPTPKTFEDQNNKLRIKVYEENGTLVIEVANTGPAVSDDTMRKLNRESQGGKPPNLTSGTRLIKHLITGVLKDEIYFANNLIGTPVEGISWFTVTIRLRPMSKYESKEDFINRQPISAVH